ncbi:hypothetical protein [Arhodomonas sp. SL1]|uniref:hypothetical protein n=1 Tax=Arhodomonas sp. SL1 TaxID=3425691 RepID=UPI003F883E2F
MQTKLPHMKTLVSCCLFTPATARAFEPAIGFGSIWLLGLIAAAPGLPLAAIALRQILPRLRDFLLVLGLWIALAPPAAIFTVNLISPGILGQTHNHPGWELFLRIWVIGSLVPWIPAWLWRRKANARRGGAR